MPATIFGVSIRHILILAILGWALAYLLNHSLDSTPENSVLEAFIRSQASVTDRIGAPIDIELTRQVIAHAGFGPAGESPGYTRSMFRVEGERGQLIVTLRQIDGEQAIEITDLRSP